MLIALAYFLAAFGSYYVFVTKPLDEKLTATLKTIRENQIIIIANQGTGIKSLEAINDVLGSSADMEQKLDYIIEHGHDPCPAGHDDK